MMQSAIMMMMRCHVCQNAREVRGTKHVIDSGTENKVGTRQTQQNRFPTNPDIEAK